MLLKKWGRDKQQNTLSPELEKNSKIINSQNGECFVIGNGPSLKRVNLNKLRDSYTITCNMFTRVFGYELIKSNAHVLADKIFFDDRDDVKYSKNELTRIWYDISKMNVPVFVPLYAKQYIIDNGINNMMDIYYLDILVNEIPDRNNNELKIDISKPINSYVNVVQFSIVLAMNMGFSRINLLGCDTTGVFGLLNAAYENSDMQYHAYDDDDSKEVMRSIVEHNKISDSLYWESFNFLGFERLYQLCFDRGIELVNLTDKTLIDGIPKEDGSRYYL